MLLRIANPNLTENDYSYGLSFKQSTSANALLPGDKMRGNSPITHVMTYLYTDSSGKTYVMDQGGIRVGNNKSSIPKDATTTYIISLYYKFTYD